MTVLLIQQKDLLRPDEVAKLFSVTQRTVYLWVELNHVEAIKVEGIIRILRKSLDNNKNI